MDIHRVIDELRAELDLIDATIHAFERLASANHETRVRPSKRRTSHRTKETGEAWAKGTPVESQGAMRA